MSFDGLFTHALVHELNQELKGGRVSKIQQPYENEIILRIRSNRKNVQLLLSAHPQYARVQLTTIPFENPTQPPQFCMMMRKHLDGAIVEEITQVENDRVIEFTFKSRDELGDTHHVVLIAELMGRHSNILLVNKQEEKIYDTIRHISPSQNSYRTLLPGAPYIPAPTQEKVNPFKFDQPLRIEGGKTKEKVTSIQQLFQGFGRDSAQELVYQLDRHKDDAPSVVFQKFLDPYKKNQYAPTLTKKERKESFTAIDYMVLEGSKESFSTLSELLDRYYRNKAERDRTQQQANDLFSIIKNELDRNKKKLIKMQKELDQTAFADEFRVKGEVLTAYLHEVQKGQKTISLHNFYEDNAFIEIELDPQKSPSENAQYYFSRYQKLKNRKKHLTTQLKRTKEEIQYLESVLHQLEIAAPSDIFDIREELQQEGYLKKKKQKGKAKTRKQSKPEQFEASDGTLILVGRNNLQNDQLTMRTANKNEWWLHAKDIPGSHVIIRSENPSEETLEQAANLAAYYSKYRQSASVPVDAVQVKHIKKPNGAKPGYVIYEGQTTYFVTPTETLVNQLKKQEK
jgi:predicted ribosome quality control (RQC) complex YloA/Tae2 family protein